MTIDVASVADQLWKARAVGDFRPAALVGALGYEDGLAVQLALLDRKIAAGEQLGGWKVGLTSPRARASIGFDQRPFGHILASRIFPTGSPVDASTLTQGGVEPEMMFTFGATGGWNATPNSVPAQA